MVRAHDLLSPRVPRFISGNPVMIRRRLRQLRANGERGTVIMLVAGCMTMMLAAGAYAMDSGAGRLTEQRAQSAADAAALAAADAIPGQQHVDEPPCGDDRRRQHRHGEPAGFHGVDHDADPDVRASDRQLPAPPTRSGWTAPAGASRSAPRPGPPRRTWVVPRARSSPRPTRAACSAVAIPGSASVSSEGFRSTAT